MPHSHPLLERLVSLTRDLILIPSTNSRPEERSRCFAFLRDHLEGLEGVAIREYQSRGFGSLVACPAGIAHPEILMVGHLDVIEHPDGSVYRSRVENGRILGPGSGDMKGQIAIMLELFCRLHHRHPGLSVGIAVTSDEEIGGENGVMHLFEREGLRCGMAIVPDGGSIHDITVAEKGILQIRLDSRGQESHAARPWLATNALLRLIEGINRATSDFESCKTGHEEASDHWYSTCVPTVLRTGNETINCIPGEAHAFLDVRFTPPHTAKEMLQRLREAVGPDIRIETIMSAESTQLAPDPLYLEVTETLTGTPPKLVRASGGSDARYIARHGIPVILSRPQVGALHSPDEWIDIESMGLYFQICEEFILRKLAVR